MTLRILSLSNCPLVESQGSGYVITGYARELRRRGHRVDLIGPERLFRFPEFHHGRSIRYPLAMLATALRQIALHDFDIVECWGAEAWLAIAVLTSIRGRKFLSLARSNGIEPHYQEYLENNGVRGRPWRPCLDVMQSLAFRRCDALTTVSNFDRDYVAKQQGWAPVLAIQNPLPSEFLNLIPSPRSPRVIGFCGNWASSKGTDVLARDVSLLMREDAELELHILGGNADVLADFSEDLRHRISVLPFTSSKSEMRERYQRCSILVAPSHFESFGLAVAEAMACGCAVISTKVGFAAGLKHGEEVYHIENAKSPHLYDALNELLNDSELRARIAQGGYRAVQNLCWKNAVDQLETMYFNMLTDRHRRNGS